MSAILPPRPTPTGIDDYKRVLLTRFGSVLPTVGAVDKASAEATDVATNLESAARNLPEAHPDKNSLVTTADQLKSIASEGKKFREKWTTENGPAEERAAEYVQRALDLQVAKSGGLLAFNGLATTVAILLLTSRSLPSGQRWVSTSLFVIVLCSSILSLSAVYVWWPSSKTFSCATADLQKSLVVAAWRAWAVNVATVLALGATALIGCWAAKGREITPHVRVSGPVQAAVARPVPIMVRDTIHARCGSPLSSARRKSVTLECVILP